MRRIKVKDLILEINNNDVNLISNYDLCLRYKPGSKVKSLQLFSDGDQIKNIGKLLNIRTEKNYLFMDHLNVPNNHRGKGLGSLSLAFFYYILQNSPYDKFAMKFGDGNKNKSFLLHHGFSSEFVHTKKDTDFKSKSAIAGKLNTYGSENYEWTIDPISISNYPTSFFEID